MKKWIKYMTLLSFVNMILVNALANILPINNQTTGQVSDHYANLFAPAGITFAIWGLIYLLLAGYTGYQLVAHANHKKAVLLNKIGVYFSISSITNALWIFSWHYEMIPISMLLMIIILITLIGILRLITKDDLTLIEKAFIKLPFSVYFGWITIATIANATVLLVSLGWNMFGLSESTWAVLIIGAGSIIGILTMLKYKSLAYGLVLIWAYMGIFIKHNSQSGFNGQYPVIMITVVGCLILFLLSGFVLVKKRLQY